MSRQLIQLINKLLPRVNKPIVRQRIIRVSLSHIICPSIILASKCNLPICQRILSVAKCILSIIGRIHIATDRIR